MLSAMCSPLRAILIVLCGFVAAGQADAAVAFSGDWRQSLIEPAAMSFAIRGTGNRNNPIRRQLAAPFSGEQLFARFRIRYAADSIDEPGAGDGEFFVLWLDATDGGDLATHSGGVPNVGIHVDRGTNAFMARFASQQERFVPGRLQGDRDYLVVARLVKTRPGADEPFDELALWVDPDALSELKPHAVARSTRSVRTVQWIGFSTGRKTEASDRIRVSDIAVAETWEAILGLPPKLGRVPVATPTVAPVVKTVHFREDVYPILKAHCFECHAGKKVKGETHLDRWDEVMNRTTPRDAAASELIDKVTSTDPETRMPPGKRRPLNETEIGVLRAWINEGLEWDETLLPSPAPRTDHWAFQPVKRPAIPAVKNADWVRTPIDAFIARRHEALGVNPAPPADDSTLRRRLALDLTGLPATAFPADGGIEDFIATLLASPHHGERYARHWLDVARWAESNGHQHNRDREHAWRYRDYVVRAFTDDKPYAEFVREQIAGDAMPFAPERVVATGFLAAARYSGNELDKDIQRNDILTDIVNTTGQALLGLTFECAQCHTHKFDPISIRDYYRLQAFFIQGQPENVVLERDQTKARELIARRWHLFDTVHARMVASKRRAGVPEPVLVIPKSVIGGMKADERRLFNELEAAIARLPQAWAFYSPVTAPAPLDLAPHPMRWPLPRDPNVLARQRAHLLIRGDVASKGPELPPGIPAVFNAPIAPTERPRLALADWLTARDNPLTARVWVNRLWQWHFGHGLVETSGDFGKQGSAPSHPDLLDWLAAELMDHGWSMKHIHRLIVNSATYRQSSAYSAGNARLDPDNVTLWRWKPRRLEAEAIRDCVLSVSRQLDPAIGGPSVPLPQGESSNRRALYIQQKRNTLPHQQMLFDGATAITSCSRRQVSTVGLQPLYLLNSAFMQRAAERFAAHLRNPAASDEAQARAAIESALQREATSEEIQRGAAHIRARGLKSFCLALFNLNEFLYLP